MHALDVGTLALIRAHEYRRSLLQMRTFLTHFVADMSDILADSRKK